MPIFSRRSIQRMFDENSSWMRPEQIYEHVKALNDPTRDTLPIIWEVAVLNALRKLGQVEHEPKVTGRTPDICFRLKPGGPLIFADINTVSDRSFHARNPIERLEEHFRKQLAPLLDSGIHGGFHLVVKDDVKERIGRGGAPTRLKIPPVKRFRDAIFNTEFIAFKRKILQQPRSPAVFVINERRGVRAIAR